MFLIIALVLAAIWLACLSDGRKTVYRLTSEGIDPAPVLVEMIIWATRHEATEAPPCTGGCRATADAHISTRRASDVTQQPVVRRRL